MKNYRFWIVLVGILALMLAGCGQAAAPTPGAATRSPIGTARLVETQAAPATLALLLLTWTAAPGYLETRSPALETAPTTQPDQGMAPSSLPTLPTPSDPGLQSLIDKAKADLAQRLSVEVNQVSLVEVTEMVWPNAGMGCPQPGMQYIQVPQDGLLIRLQVDDRIYNYHSGGAREPFLCELKYKEPPLTPESLQPPSVDD